MELIPPTQMHDVGNGVLTRILGVEYRASLSWGRAFPSSPMPVELGLGLL